MQITKTFALVLAASTLFVSAISQAEFLGQDSIFTGVRRPTKGEEGLPRAYKKFNDAFTVSDDAIDATNEARVDESHDNRTPASAAEQKQKSAKPKTHWSASTSDGFEFKIRVKQQLSAVWVLKRETHYDLIFANNSGSRVNLSLPAEQFYALKNAASDLRAPASDLTACKDSFVQLEMVEQSTRKVVSTCLNTKSKAADELRRFGSALTAYVR